MDDLEKPRATSNGSQSCSLQKDGLSGAILIGLPNSSKFRLLSSFTDAVGKVAAYPFTTKVPQPGIVRYQKRVFIAGCPCH